MRSNFNAGSGRPMGRSLLFLGAVGASRGPRGTFLHSCIGQSACPPSRLAALTSCTFMLGAHNSEIAPSVRSRWFLRCGWEHAQSTQTTRGQVQYAANDRCAISKGHIACCHIQISKYMCNQFDFKSGAVPLVI